MQASENHNGVAQECMKLRQTLTQRMRYGQWRDKVNADEKRQRMALQPSTKNRSQRQSQLQRLQQATFGFS